MDIYSYDIRSKIKVNNDWKIQQNFIQPGYIPTKKIKESLIKKKLQNNKTTYPCQQIQPIFNNTKSVIMQNQALIKNRTLSSSQIYDQFLYEQKITPNIGFRPVKQEKLPRFIDEQQSKLQKTFNIIDMRRSQIQNSRQRSIDMNNQHYDIKFIQSNKQLFGSKQTMAQFRIFRQKFKIYQMQKGSKNKSNVQNIGQFLDKIQSMKINAQHL